MLSASFKILRDYPYVEEVPPVGLYALMHSSVHSKFPNSVIGHSTALLWTDITVLNCKHVELLNNWVALRLLIL
jgi:hypothetical protein